MGCMKCVNKLKPDRKIDFVMLFGLIGLVYNVFEKLFMGGAGYSVKTFRMVKKLAAENESLPKNAVPEAGSAE